jgi:hypothetical protein
VTISDGRRVSADGITLYCISSYHIIASFTYKTYLYIRNQDRDREKDRETTHKNKRKRTITGRRFMRENRYTCRYII